jgi:hypothetical protein
MVMQVRKRGHMKRFFTTISSVTLAGLITIFVCYYCFNKAFNNHVPTTITYVVQQNVSPSQSQETKHPAAIKSIPQSFSETKPVFDNGLEAYFCRLTDFYQVIIGMLTTLIFIILALVFLYSIKMSKAHVEETLESEKYNRELEQKVQALLLKLQAGKEDEMAGFADEIDELKQKYDLFEKAISDKEEKLVINKEDGNGDNRN